MKVSLLLEDKELVADEVPDEGDAGREEFGDVCPEYGGYTEYRSDEGGDTRDDTAIDAGSEETDADELREFRFFSIAGNILECPVFVHEVAVDDCDEEGDGIEYEKSAPARDAGELDLDVQHRKINGGIDAADEDEFRKLFRHTCQSFSGEIHVSVLSVYLKSHRRNKKIQIIQTCRLKYYHFGCKSRKSCRNISIFLLNFQNFRSK